MAVVLLGAALHAVWNALVRASAQKFQHATLIVFGAGVWTALLLPFAPLPAPASWPYLAASAVIHVAYFSLVALAYRGADLSLAYPLMRGSAPVLSALGAALLLGESPTAGGWMGVLLIACGVIALAGDAWRARTIRAAPVLYALSNAGVIVVYTLVDGHGVRLSGHAFSYTGWLFLLTALLFLLLRGARDAGAVRQQVLNGWRTGMLGGACTLASYGLALWAMTRAPIALVAALRETSVIFGVIIAALWLKEPVTRLRALSIALVCAGAAAIRAL